MKIKDLAKIIGVSPATISNALNNKKGVSDEQRQRIIEMAKKHGYEKKENLKKEKKGIIRFIVFKNNGLVFGDTPFFSDLIEGIERKSSEEGYELAVSHVMADEIEKIKDLTSNTDIEGVIILATEMLQDNLEILKIIKQPLVIVDSYFKGKNYDFVLIDNCGGVRKSVDYLIKNGHKKIGYLKSSNFINNFFYRFKEFKEAMADNFLDIDCKYELMSTLEGSYIDMKKIISDKKNNLPTAFIADNDIIAIGVIKALTESGIRIPEDISIIGFDDMPFSEIINPRLTTVKVFKEYFGRVAVKRLIEKINFKDDITLKIEVLTELIERDSVKKLS